MDPQQRIEQLRLANKQALDEILKVYKEQVHPGEPVILGRDGGNEVWMDHRSGATTIPTGQNRNLFMFGDVPDPEGKKERVPLDMMPHNRTIGASSVAKILGMDKFEAKAFNEAKKEKKIPVDEKGKFAFSDIIKFFFWRSAENIRVADYKRRLCDIAFNVAEYFEKDDPERARLIHSIAYYLVWKPLPSRQITESLVDKLEVAYKKIPNKENPDLRKAARKIVKEYEAVKDLLKPELKPEGMFCLQGHFLEDVTLALVQKISGVEALEVGIVTPTRQPPPPDLGSSAEMQKYIACKTSFLMRASPDGVGLLGDEDPYELEELSSRINVELKSPSFYPGSAGISNSTSPMDLEFIISSEPMRVIAYADSSEAADKKEKFKNNLYHFKKVPFNYILQMFHQMMCTKKRVSFFTAMYNKPRSPKDVLEAAKSLPERLRKEVEERWVAVYEQKMSEVGFSKAALHLTEEMRRSITMDRGIDETDPVSMLKMPQKDFIERYRELAVIYRVFVRPTDAIAAWIFYSKDFETWMFKYVDAFTRLLNGPGAGFDATLEEVKERQGNAGLVLSEEETLEKLQKIKWDPDLIYETDPPPPLLMFTKPLQIDPDGEITDEGLVLPRGKEMDLHLRVHREMCRLHRKRVLLLRSEKVMTDAGLKPAIGSKPQRMTLELARKAVEKVQMQQTEYQNGVPSETDEDISAWLDEIDF